MIMIGEIRGAEGNIAFQAMQTGHPVMATFHASSVEKVIQRLTGDPINVPKVNIDNLDLVVIQSAVRAPDGSTVRRVSTSTRSAMNRRYRCESTSWKPPALPSGCSAGSPAPRAIRRSR